MNYHMFKPNSWQLKKLIGKSLFGQNFSQWISTLDRLRDNKSKNIMNVLQMSYDDFGEKDWK